MSLLYHLRTRDEAIVSATTTPALQTNLLACVDAIQNYLDTLLAMDAAQWDILPFEEWSRTIATFFILYKLAAGPREIRDWDVGLCRSTVDLAEYLDVAAERLSHSSYSLEPAQHPSDGLHFVLPAILRSARKSFLLVRDTPHLIKPGDRVHVDLSKEQIAQEIARPQKQRRCPATAFWTTSALVLDQETDWCEVYSSSALDPAAQLAKNESLWSDLLGGNASGDGA